VKRVLVTGASGFVGSQTLSRLLARGFDVHAVSRNERPIGDVRWHSCDLLAATAAQELVDRVDPTHLLHLAWFTEPGAYWTSRANVDWVEASLRLLRSFAKPNRRAVVSGSCAEYDWSFGYCSERITPLRPTSLYGVCKQSLYAIGEGLAAATDLSFGWGRIFFLYGPNEHPNRLVSSVVRALLRDTPAQCTAGTQIRDFLHVEDVASAFVDLLESEVEGPVNIASGEPASVRQVLATIGDILGRQDLIEIGALPLRSDEPPLLVADTRRLTTEVGWQPAHSLRSGLEQTVDWWRALLNDQAF
jgi:nucleoside-diphosphate-sugar epimerase